MILCEILLLLFSGAMLLLGAGILFCTYLASMLVVAAGWYRRKRWLIWIGAIPFGLLTLAWIWFCLVFFPV